MNFASSLQRCGGRMLAAACVVVAATPAAAQTPTLDRIRQTGQFVIAHEAAAPPFAYVVDGRPMGYTIDLCERLARAVQRELGLKRIAIVYRQVATADRVQTVAGGAADVECGSATNNAVRRRQVSFTIPHYVTGARYLVRADSEIDALEHFEGKRVVSVTNTTPLQALDAANRERLLRIQLQAVDEMDRAVELVEAGQVHGFVMDDVLLYGLAAGRPDPDKLRVVGKFLTIEPLAIMLSKDDPAFKRIVDDEMRRLIYSREIYAIYERWFNKPIPPQNRSLNLPISYLLRDYWRYPTDWSPI